MPLCGFWVVVWAAFRNGLGMVRSWWRSGVYVFMVGFCGVVDFLSCRTIGLLGLMKSNDLLSYFFFVLYRVFAAPFLLCFFSNSATARGAF